MISLVEESAERTNEEIKRDIIEDLLKEPASIPWLKKVDKVTIKEE